MMSVPIQPPKSDVIDVEQNGSMSSTELSKHVLQNADDIPELTEIGEDSTTETVEVEELTTMDLDYSQGEIVENTITIQNTSDEISSCDLVLDVSNDQSWTHEESNENVSSFMGTFPPLSNDNIIQTFTPQQIHFASGAVPFQASLHGQFYFEIPSQQPSPTQYIPAPLPMMQMAPFYDHQSQLALGNPSISHQIMPIDRNMLQPQHEQIINPIMTQFQENCYSSAPYEVFSPNYENSIQGYYQARNEIPPKPFTFSVNSKQFIPSSWEELAPETNTNTGRNTEDQHQISSDSLARLVEYVGDQYHDKNPHTRRTIILNPRKNSKNDPVVYYRFYQFSCPCLGKVWFSPLHRAREGCFCRDCHDFLKPFGFIDGLTPYMGHELCYGKFECHVCGRSWSCQKSRSNFPDNCFDCGTIVYPYYQVSHSVLRKKIMRQQTSTIRFHHNPLYSSESSCDSCEDFGISLESIVGQESKPKVISFLSPTAGITVNKEHHTATSSSAVSLPISKKSNNNLKDISIVTSVSDPIIHDYSRGRK